MHRVEAEERNTGGKGEKITVIVHIEKGGEGGKVLVVPGARGVDRPPMQLRESKKGGGGG